MKRCTRCKQAKPLAEFSKNKKEKDGYKCYCKKCVSELWKEGNYRTCCRGWRANNREKSRAMALKYTKENPIWDIVRVERRRAIKNNCKGTFTDNEWIDLCNRYGNVCLCCGKKRKLTVDHIIPISIGGSNGIDNIQPLCRECNSSKHTRIIDYRPEAKFYPVQALNTPQAIVTPEK